MAAMLGWFSEARTWAFSRKAGQAIRIERERVRQHLQRDVTIQLAVSGAIHLAHTARAEGRDDFVGAEATSGGQGHGRRLTGMRSF
jgi:hypothetical protein